MGQLEVKNVAEPDETRPFPARGKTDLVTVGGRQVVYATFEPGFRWSEHLKPAVGTESCQATHLYYCVSGRMRYVTDEGQEGEVRPGDVASIGPGHDNWVVGGEPCVVVDFGSYPHLGADH